MTDARLRTMQVIALLVICVIMGSACGSSSDPQTVTVTATTGTPAETEPAAATPPRKASFSVVVELLDRAGIVTSDGGPFESCMTIHAGEDGAGMVHVCSVVTDAVVSCLLGGLDCGGPLQPDADGQWTIRMSADDGPGSYQYVRRFGANVFATVLAASDSDAVARSDMEAIRAALTPLGESANTSAG